jgi:hypothetical protein
VSNKQKKQIDWQRNGWGGFTVLPLPF